MNINWNPFYAPVWYWLRNHAMAALGFAVGLPAAASALVAHGVPIDPVVIEHLKAVADTVKSVAGTLAALGFLGDHHLSDAPTRP